MSPIRQLINIGLTGIAAVTFITTGNTTAEPAPSTTSSTTSTSSSTSSTSSSTTSTSSTTTSTTEPALGFEPKCPTWVPILRYVGFEEHELATADRILWAESRCRADAVNSFDCHGGFQIHAVWLDWFLPQLGIAWTRADLLDPVTNAAAALAIVRRQGGWQAWTTY